MACSLDDAATQGVRGVVALSTALVSLRQMPRGGALI